MKSKREEGVLHVFNNLSQERIRIIYSNLFNITHILPKW